MLLPHEIWAQRRIALPNSVAIHRTESDSGPVKFNTSGGELQCCSACRHAEFASPCQMTFAMPMDKSTVCRSKTR